MHRCTRQLYPDVCGEVSVVQHVCWFASCTNQDHRILVEQHHGRRIREHIATLLYSTHRSQRTVLEHSCSHARREQALAHGVGTRRAMFVRMGMFHPSRVSAVNASGYVVYAHGERDAFP